MNHHLDIGINMGYWKGTDNYKEPPKPTSVMLYFLIVYIVGAVVAISLLTYSAWTFSSVDYVVLSYYHNVGLSYGQIYWLTAVILALLFFYLYRRGIKKSEFIGTLSIFIPAGILLLILANLAWGWGDYFHTLLWSFNLGGMICLSIARRIMLAGWLGLGNGLLLLCFNVVWWSDIQQSEKWLNAALLLCSVILLGLSFWQVRSRRT
jgi:hypothetical protein